MASKGKDGKTKGAALGKRAKIDSAQRGMLVSVGIASVIFGIAVVGVIYFVKLISFNSKLITVKDEIIEVYINTQNNLKKISNRVSELSVNEYLESVGRMRKTDCESNSEGVEDGVTEVSLDRLETVRECSALRVITDALPYQENEDSTLTAFYILLILANNGSTVERVAKSDASRTTINGMDFGTISIGVNFSDTPTHIRNSLASIESSIRSFDVINAVISYAPEDEDGFAIDSIDLNATYRSYYAGKLQLNSVKRTVCAKSDNQKCAEAGGDNSIVEMGLGEE